jgi:hypothetical protein
MRFIVDIEPIKVAWLVRFRMIRLDQQDNLLAIMNGLKCLGLPPRIYRITAEIPHPGRFPKTVG